MRNPDTAVPRVLPRFTLRLDDAMYEALRQHCFDHHVPMNRVVRDAIAAYLAAAPARPVAGEVIADELGPLVRQMRRLKEHPQNPRRGNVEGIAESLKRFGQVRAILAQASTGYVVAGNHTFRAARSLGWKRIAVARVPMTDDDALAYMLTDNQLSDQAVNDDEGLVAILRHLEERDALPPGYVPADLDELIARVNENHVPNHEPTDDPPARLDRSSVRTCPSCGHSWVESGAGQADA